MVSLDIGSDGGGGDNYSYRSTTLSEKTNRILLTIAFGISVFLLYLTANTAAQNHSMLSSLQPYVVDVMNVTNKTWGYGEMPIKMAQVDKVPGGHHHSEPSATDTALDPQDTTFMLKDTWVTPQGQNPHTSFPTTSDTLDELRPDEVVSYETNFLVKKHVSTVLLHNRRVMANLTYRLSHPICTVQAFFSPLQYLQTFNKTLVASNSPIDVHLLAYPPDGPWWAAKGFNSPENGKKAFRSNMTWNSKPARVRKLGTIHPWMGINQNTDTFDCPMPDERLGKKAERIAVEYSCTPGATEESCYFGFDARMTYPMLILEVVF